MWLTLLLGAIAADLRLGSVLGAVLRFLGKVVRGLAGPVPGGALLLLKALLVLEVALVKVLIVVCHCVFCYYGPAQSRTHYCTL